MHKVSIGKRRNSSIELLKVVAIFLIVCHHVIQSLYLPSEVIESQPYLIDLSVATTNIQQFIIVLFNYGGVFGNTVFFICSAWFLLDNDEADLKKILRMLLDVWIISIVILIIVYFLRRGDVSFRMIKESMLPTTFANNWYVTCYILFYPLHTYLNRIVKTIKERQLLRCTLVLMTLYVCIGFIIGDHFFSSPIIVWITIYFMIAYMKYYLEDVSNNIRINIILFLCGIFGNCGLVLFTNIIGIKTGLCSDWLFTWEKNCNPFIIVMVIGLFNIARNISFKNKVINYVSSLSLFIYIIHENLLLRTYYRPLMWEFVYENVGYNQIVLCVLIITSVVFLFGLLSSCVYTRLVQKTIYSICDRLYLKLSYLYVKTENDIVEKRKYK